MLDLDEPQRDSLTQTSRHTIVRQTIHKFSNFLNAIRENLTNDQITQNVYYDLQKNLSMVHNRLF